MSSRPSDVSPLRRILMQSIMWVILAATVGLAALVDAHKTRQSVVTLGEPQTIKDFSLRLPEHWDVGGEELMDPSAALELREDGDEMASRVIDVVVDTPNLFDAISRMRQRASTHLDLVTAIRFGDQPATLNVYRDEEHDPEAGASYFVLRCEVSRPLDQGRVLTLRLSHAGVHSSGRTSQHERDEDVTLITKIAASFTR